MLLRTFIPDTEHMQMLDRLSSPVIVVSPDSFKGSLDAVGVANSIARGVLKALPSAKVLTYPMADGGEGSLDALTRNGRASHLVSVRGAAGAGIEARLGCPDDETVVLETAGIVGITDPVAMLVDAHLRHSSGIGEAIKSALDMGKRRVLVALGGSSTNDAGAGMLAALGVRFFDGNGSLVCPTPASLATIERIDVSHLDARLLETEIVGLSDVDNPLTGPLGATVIFGPQKGFSPAQTATLDSQIVRFSTMIEAAFGRECRNAPGSGAAGGLGFALMLLGGRLASGAELVADAIGLPAAIQRADWVITGEGRSDRQTLGGKAPFVVARLAHAAGVPITLLSGSIDLNALEALGQHFSGCFSPASGPMTLDEAIRHAPSLLECAAEQLARLHFLPRLHRTT